MADDDPQPNALLDLREKCFAFELTTLAILLPMLRVLPAEVKNSLLFEVRNNLVPLADQTMFDPARVAGHVGYLVDQIECILALETAPDARPN